MEMNSASVEAVVKQVLESMLEGKPAVKAPVAKANTGSNEIPKTAHVAMLTALENYEVKEFPMPEVGDDDIHAVLAFRHDGYESADRGSPPRRVKRHLGENLWRQSEV